MVPAPFYIRIPHEIELKNRSTWVNHRQYEYFAYRTHYLVRPRHVNREAQVGEIIGMFGAPAAPGRKWTHSQEDEWEVANTQESIRQVLWEDETKAAITTEIGGEISALNVAKSTSKLKTAMERKFRQQDSAQTRVAKTTTSSRKTRFEWEFPLPEQSSDRWCAAAMYHQIAYDVYLTWVDFLFIGYSKRSLFSLSRKRYKHPEVRVPNHENWIDIHRPVCTILIWSLIENAATIHKESEYRQQVDPYEILIEPLNASTPRTDRPKKVPTLYKLSNYAFPLKWSDELLTADEEEPQTA